MTAILLVEDDHALAEGLRYNLEKAGYTVTWAADGEEALQRATDSPCDLMVLDLMLPRRSGFEVLEELGRRRTSFPVLILSAKDQEMDKVRGFDLGAADYVTKPFSLAELLARIKVRLAERQESSVFDLGPMQVDLESFEVRQGTRTTHLTQTEVAILRALLRERERTVSREALLSSLWSLRGGSTRTLDTHVARLRKKLEPDPGRPRHLRTVHGVGYRLSLRGEDPE